VDISADPQVVGAGLDEICRTVYYDTMRDLGNRLMSLFARGLGLPPGFFASLTGQGANALRAINYPPGTPPRSPDSCGQAPIPTTER